MRKILTAALAVTAAFCLCGCSIGDAIMGAGENVINFFADRSEETTEAPEEETAAPENITNDISVGIYDFDTFDPLNTVSDTVKDACGFIFEPLYSIDTSYKAVPVLAESCERSGDGLTLTVHLKQGVIWHDGTELNAGDIVYTINRIKGGTANYGELAAGFSSVYEQDAYTVVIQLSRPQPEAELLLSFPIVKNGSVFSDSPDGSVVGTGPFYMAGKSGENEYRLAAFDAHHDGRAAMDSVYISMIPDKDKYISLFGANEINVATSEVIDMMTFMPKSNSKVTDYVSNDMTFLGFNTRSAVFADAGTRRGVSMLIDRDTIVTHIYFSRAQAADYAMNPSSWLNFDTRAKLSDDMQGAETLFREAGWRPDANGIYYREMERRLVYFQVEILVNRDSPQKVSVAEEICDDLSLAGIAAEVDECGYDEYVSRINSGDYDLFVGETKILPNGDLTPLAGSAGNYFGYSNQEIDTLLAQMGTVTLESDLKAVSISLCEKLRDESPFAPICFSKKSIITGAKIKSWAAPSESGFVRETEKWGVK